MKPRPPTGHCPRCDSRLEARTVTRTGELWGRSFTFQETELHCPRCAPADQKGRERE